MEYDDEDEFAKIESAVLRRWPGARRSYRLPQHPGGSWVMGRYVLSVSVSRERRDLYLVDVIMTSGGGGPPASIALLCQLCHTGLDQALDHVMMEIVMAA